MKPIEIKPDIYWVGAIDWAVRDFHGYITPHGTTYNNYLIKDEQVTIVDCVKHDFVSTSLANIKAVVDPTKIVNLIINHIEPDHVSGISEIMSVMPQAVIYISERGKKGLERYADTTGWTIKIVKSGDSLNIGKYTLSFLETPMLHWPDSMVTYIKEAKLLISQDAFGQHLATAQRFDDEFLSCHSLFELEDAVKDYYATSLCRLANLSKQSLQRLLNWASR